MAMVKKKDEAPLEHCLLFDNGDESLIIDTLYNLSLAPRSYPTVLVRRSGMSRTNLSNDVIGLVPAFLYPRAGSTVSVDV